MPGAGAMTDLILLAATVVFIIAVLMRRKAIVT